MVTSVKLGTDRAHIEEVGAGARAHPWDGDAPFEIAFKVQTPVHHWRPPLGEILYPGAPPPSSITGRPPLGEILYPGAPPPSEY